MNRENRIKDKEAAGTRNTVDQGSCGGRGSLDKRMGTVLAQQPLKPPPPPMLPEDKFSVLSYTP